MANGADALNWSRDNQPIHNGQDGVELKQLDDILVLKISRLEAEHSGNYTCTAQNREGSSSFSAFLSVPAPPRWINVPKDLHLSTKEATELRCEASGFPPPAVTWKRHGGSFSSEHILTYTYTLFSIASSSSPSPVVLHTGTKIVLNRDTDGIAGSYECVAENEHGRIQQTFDVSFSRECVRHEIRFPERSNRNFTEHRCEVSVNIFSSMPPVLEFRQMAGGWRYLYRSSVQLSNVEGAMLASTNRRMSFTR